MGTTEKAFGDFLSGGGEMGERIRNFEWEETALGEPGKWSQSLKSVVGLMLANRFPMILWWGKEYLQFYNDPYIPIPGLKHPKKVLGQPANECWTEIWNVIGPLIDTPFNGGPATWMDDILLKVNRNNFTEETHFTIAYSPVPDATAPNGIGGVLATVNEITEAVISKRQMETLKDLGINMSGALSEDEVYSKATNAFATNFFDIPFSLIYKITNDGKEANLIASLGVEKHHVELPEKIDMQNPGSGSKNLATAVVENKIFVTENDRQWENPPTGAWDVMPHSFVYVPLKAANKKLPLAVLIIGLNPYRKFDDTYKNFVQLIADQISLGINNAIAYEEERKRAEALAEIDKAKTVFFSNISHEFRTPLTLMLGPIEEVLRDSNTIPVNLTRVEVVHRNSLRLLKLVNSLLDFSRIESGRQKAIYTLTDISSFTRHLAGNFRSVIEKAGLKLIVNTEFIVQPTYVDKQMWEKIVFNLLSNAFKYTLNGQIIVSVFSDNSRAILQVEDTGVGIPEKELPHMFERFHRVQNTTGRTFEGTGIGLSLIKELVNLHGGTVTVESEVGKGSKFSVAIPFGKEHLDIAHVSNAEKDFGEDISKFYVEEAFSFLDAASTDKAENKQKHLHANASTVLVVDDNADMREHIEIVLGKMHRVITAANGLEALEKMNTEKPSIILSDIMMPVMDGIQLLKKIKSNPATAQIPVIFLTARAGEESRIEGYQMGADDYLVKPFSARELLTRVRAQIEIAETRRRDEKRIRDFFMRAPAAIAIMEGPEHICTLANSLFQKLSGRNEQQLIGQTIRQVWPELEGQHIYEIFDNVFRSGEPFIAHDFPVSLLHNGVKRDRFYDFVAHPMRNSMGQVSHVMIHAIDVTMQVRVRRKIEASEAKFRNLVKQAAVAIVVYSGPNYIVETINDYALEMWGKKKEEVINRKFFDISPELSEIKNILDNVFLKGETFKGNELAVMYKRRGSMYNGFFNFVLEPVLNDENEITGVMSVGIEVTDQVLARKTIQESEERFRMLANEAPIFVWLTDENLQTTYVNKIALDYFHLDGSVNMKDLSWKKYFHPDDLERILATMHDSREKHKPYNLEMRLKDVATGKYRWFADQGVPRYNEGKFIGFIGTSFDIDDRKEAENAIKRNEAQLKDLANAMPQMVWIAGSDGIVTYYNDRIAEFAGTNRLPDGNWTCEGLFHPDDLQKTTETWQRSVREETIYEMEHRLQMKDGTYRWHLSRAFPQRNEEGFIDKWYGTATDIHEQKTASEKLENIVTQRTAELTKQNAELESFNYVSSHDLQEPLRKIQTFIELIRANTGDKTVKEKYFDKIDIAAKRMSTLIDSLLSYSKLSNNESKFVETNLNEILRHVKTDFELFITEKNATIEIGRLPVIRGIPFQLNQLFSNLFSNSLKFSKKDPIINITGKIVPGDKLMNHPGIDHKQAFAEIEFSDNGIGFESQYSEQIFRLFQRLHGRSEYSGTGIGLALCKKIVENHNGVIYAQGELKKGATFKIYLPVNHS